MMELFSLNVSPFSERCKFGLHLAGVDEQYTVTEYVPFATELYLRYRMGCLLLTRRQVSVPVLFLSRNEYVEGSLRILEHFAANTTTTTKPSIFPADRARVQQIESTVDGVLKAWRFRFAKRLSEDPHGKFDVENLPAPVAVLLCVVPAAVHSFFARQFGGMFLSKYYLGNGEQTSYTLDVAREEMRRGLLELRGMLGKNAFFVEDRITVADVLASSALAFAPLPTGEHNHAGANLGAKMRDDDLAQEFADLVRWRDALYAAHRGSPK